MMQQNLLALLACGRFKRQRLPINAVIVYLKISLNHVEIYLKLLMDKYRCGGGDVTISSPCRYSFF